MLSCNGLYLRLSGEVEVLRVTQSLEAIILLYR